MRSLLAISAALILAGCVSEQPATGTQVQKLGEQCQAYGFKPGTDQFATCIFNLDQQRIAANRDRRQRVGAALASAGAGMQANANRGLNCSSYRVGNTVQTRCN